MNQQRRMTKQGVMMGASAKIDPSKLSSVPIPGDLLGDLSDAFAFYDTDEDGLISITHFRNILHNFGFHKMTKKEIDDELKRHDS